MLPKRTSAGTCSSSASSDVASVFEDDYDYDDHVLVNDHHPPFDHIPDHDNTIKLHRSPPGLSFARRPSTTDNRTLIPILHLHDTTSSSSSTTATRTRKSSNPTIAHRHSRSHDMHRRLASSTPIPIPSISSGTPPPSHAAHPAPHPHPHPAPAKPKRLRSSLPTYFLHLSLSSHTQTQSTSPPSGVIVDGGHVSASASNGDANANANAYAGGTTDVEATPRTKRHYGTRGKGGDRDTAFAFRDIPADRDVRADYHVSQPGFGSGSYGRGAVPIPGTQEVERGCVKEWALRVRKGRYVSESEGGDHGREGGVGERRGRSRVVTTRLES